MSKSEYKPPPAPNYNSHQGQQGYNNYYPPQSQSQSSQPPAYNQGYSQQYQQQQGYHPGYQQPQYAQQQQYYAPQQQQPVYVQQQQRPSGFQPGSSAWSWCCGALSLAMCVEMLLVLIPF